MKKLFAVLAAVLLLAIMACSSKSDNGGDATEPTTYSITGQITSNGTGLAGVTISLSGASTAQTTTDSSGNYSFTNQGNGDYAVTPSLASYILSPSVTVVTISGTNRAGINFTATANTTPTYSISGTVSGAVASGVTITLAGENTGSTLTDSSGNYSFSSAANGNYTLTASKTGYTFSSPISVIVNNANVTGHNFTAIANSSPNDYPSANIGTLKYVPAGSFQRDATSTNISTVSAFRMSEYEITRAQFKAIMGIDPSDTKYSTGTNDPVQKVNWYHAITFCNKLSIAEGLTPVYSVSGVNFSTLTYAAIPTTSDKNWDAATANWGTNGYRLPTEMEWMWAAMGATSDGRGADIVGGVNTGGYTKGYPGSIEAGGVEANFSDYEWTWGNSFVNKTTQPVGTKLANELGLHDMGGNVAEWCWDWYADNGHWPQYAISGTVTNYRGGASGDHRVFRGGSWQTVEGGATIAYRAYYLPYFQEYTFGFRVVLP